MRVVKAAGVQLSPVLYSREGTVDKVVQKIHELGQQGVQFVTFPETVVPYYPYFSIVQSGYQILRGGEFLKLLDQSVTVSSPATNAISEACKQAGVVASIGVNERDGGTLYNTQLLFDADGILIQRRRKITPTHYERMSRRTMSGRTLSIPISIVSVTDEANRRAVSWFLTTRAWASCFMLRTSRVPNPASRIPTINNVTLRARLWRSTSFTCEKSGKSRSVLRGARLDQLLEKEPQRR